VEANVDKPDEAIGRIDFARLVTTGPACNPLALRIPPAEMFRGPGMRTSFEIDSGAAIFRIASIESAGNIGCQRIGVSKVGGDSAALRPIAFPMRSPAPFVWMSMCSNSWLSWALVVCDEKSSSEQTDEQKVERFAKGRHSEILSVWRARRNSTSDKVLSRRIPDKWKFETASAARMMAAAIDGNFASGIISNRC
jgi:hypothetical protein